MNKSRKQKTLCSTSSLCNGLFYSILPIILINFRYFKILWIKRFTFQAYIVEVLFPNRPVEIANCWMVYNQSRNHNDLFTFEACIQTLLGIDEDISGRIKIFKKVCLNFIRNIFLSKSGFISL